MKRRSTRRKASLGATNQVEKRLEVGEEGICETPDIGKDVMFEVLARLPIESLLRFKAVSKYWFRLISNPEFIKFRLRNACGDPKFLFLEMDKNDGEGETDEEMGYYAWLENCEIVLHQAPLHPTLYDPLHPTLYDPDTSCYQSPRQLLIDISYPMEFREEESMWELTFVGSCSGLVCIAGHNHRVIVWNPALRKCKRLPYFGRGSPISYGFGYDEASDDINVVGIQNTPKTLVKMYSARTNSWKKLQEDDFVVDGHGCLLYGKLHWATNKGMIFSVDLSSERFGVMEPPDCTRDPKCRDWSVHAAGEFLAVFCFYGTNDPSTMATANLWLMERYGVKESWTRVCDDGADPRHMPWIVYKENTKLNHQLCLTFSEPSEPWRPIPTPDHMTGNGVIAFLLHCYRKYSFNNAPFFLLLVVSQAGSCVCRKLNLAIFVSQRKIEQE